MSYLMELHAAHCARLARWAAAAAAVSQARPTAATEIDLLLPEPAKKKEAEPMNTPAKKKEAEPMNTQSAMESAAVLALPPPPPPLWLTSGHVIAEVCRHFGLRRQDLASDRRTAQFVWPRHVAMYLMRELVKDSFEHALSFPRIGRTLGDRDHTTVLHGYRKVQAAVAAGGDDAEVVLRMRERLLAKVAPTPENPG